MKQLKAILFLAAAMVAMVGCGPDTPEDDGQIEVKPGDISLEIDRNYILSDGTDAATIKVVMNAEDGTKQDITSVAEIYVNDGAAPLSNNVFTTAEAGDYRFYAFYGVKMTEEEVIYAYSQLPDAPADEQPNNTAFHHRLMLMQHTGTGCVNCPRMMKVLKVLAEDANYNDKYTHVALHSYKSDDPDPCYSDAAKNFSLIYCSGYYPEVTFNLMEYDRMSAGADLGELQNYINELSLESAEVGIAAAAICTEGDLLLNVDLKAARSGDYRVGVWVIEDDIFGTQLGADPMADWQHIHENALRATVTNADSRNNFSGEPVAELRNDTKAERFFRIDVADNWKAENCEFVIYVTAKNSEGVYDVINSTVCSVGSTVGYDYK